MQVRPVARPRAAQPRPCEHVSRHYMQAVLVHLMPGVRSAPPCTVVPGAGADKEKKGTNAVPAPCVAWRLAASGRRAAGWLATASGEKAAAGRGNTMSAVPSISTRSASIALSGLQLAGSPMHLKNFRRDARRCISFHFCFCAKQKQGVESGFHCIPVQRAGGPSDGGYGGHQGRRRCLQALHI